MNLLQETKEILEKHNKTLQDVFWVGSTTLKKGQWIRAYTTVEDFVKRADRDYDEGYGQEEVNTKLIIVGEHFWLERCTYDGSEWWEYKEFPNINDFEPNVGKVPIFYKE